MTLHSASHPSQTNILEEGVGPRDPRAACTTTIALCIEARDVDLIAIHNNVKALTLQIDAILFVQDVA